MVNSITGRLLLFLLLNFGALGLGAVFTRDGVTSAWYAELEKAPWTPPGWVFGFAWTTIMICFAVYMALLWPETGSKTRLSFLFGWQWLLNVAWNPVFFHFHAQWAGLLVISALTVLIGSLLFLYRSPMRIRSALLLPYFAWLLVATSLNGYIVFNN